MPQDGDSSIGNARICLAAMQLAISRALTTDSTAVQLRRISDQLERLPSHLITSAQFTQAEAPFDSWLDRVFCEKFTIKAHKLQLNDWTAAIHR